MSTPEPQPPTGSDATPGEDAGAAAGAGRRLDPLSLAMVLVAVVALGATAWLRFGPGREPEPPRVGTVPPPLRLLDAHTGEPIVLLGLREKVVWITFWSAASPSAQADLKELEGVWRLLKDRPRFAMIAAAVEADRPALARAAVAATGATLPVYLANSESRRAFGASQTPLHLLLDADGRVLALARGREPGVLSRLRHLAEQRLDALEPPRSHRFAAKEAHPSAFGSLTNAFVFRRGGPWPALGGPDNLLVRAGAARRRSRLTFPSAPGRSEPSPPRRLSEAAGRAQPLPSALVAARPGQQVVRATRK